MNYRGLGGGKWSVEGGERDDICYLRILTFFLLKKKNKIFNLF